MTTDQAVQKRSKAHQRYKTSDGRPCVGVTTVTGKIAKPYLVNWANKLGLDGYDVGTYVDALARIGTLAHRSPLSWGTVRPVASGRGH